MHTVNYVAYKRAIDDGADEAEALRSERTWRLRREVERALDRVRLDDKRLVIRYHYPDDEITSLHNEEPPENPEAPIILGDLDEAQIEILENFEDRREHFRKAMNELITIISHFGEARQAAKHYLREKALVPITEAGYDP